MYNLKKLSVLNLIILFLFCFTLVKANSASNYTKIAKDGFRLCQNDDDNQNPSDIYQEPDNQGDDNGEVPQPPVVTPPPDSDTDIQ